MVNLQKDSTIILKNIYYSECNVMPFNDTIVPLALFVRTDKACDLICHFDKDLKLIGLSCEIILISPPPKNKRQEKILYGDRSVLWK